MRFDEDDLQKKNDFEFFLTGQRKFLKFVRYLKKMPMSLFEGFK